MMEGNAADDTLRDEIQAIVRDHLPKGVDALPENADLFAYGLDSMALISMIVELEEKFAFQFDLEDLRLERFSTIDCIATLVRSKPSRISDVAAGSA